MFKKMINKIKSWFSKKNIDEIKKDVKKGVEVVEKVKEVVKKVKK